MKNSENRSDEETRTIRRLKKIHRITGRYCSLFEEFAEMPRDKGPKRKEQARERLEAWAREAKASGVTELKTFAIVKLLQDTEAVAAAMILPYGQGQTEGQVNNSSS